MCIRDRSQFGSQAATRLREAGIASNRGSACRGEYVPGPCTHRPSHHEDVYKRQELGVALYKAQDEDASILHGIAGEVILQQL